MMRLQKYIADSGITSRRKAEQLIVDGKIKVNGEVITKLGTVIDELNDTVEYAGKKINLKSKKIYLALNKPIGYVSSTVSTQGQSVLTLINTHERIYPVGRLDKDSSGLLILTNDGELANVISHPKNGSEKEYFVVLDQDLKPDDVRKLERGMIIDGKRLRPVKVSSIKNRSARLVLKEGVNRQIRRQLGKLGYTVVKLKRIRIGKLELGDLPEGHWREIKITEL
ncbi:MAG: pseudouridine synthase [Patescibacteria group bacterium]|nr:pseudouridine synthase [Patescibacteria group bacterium]